MKSLDKKKPKTESWVEKLNTTLDTYECLIDTSQEEYKMARRYLELFVATEKQLSYQEGVEKTVEKLKSWVKTHTYGIGEDNGEGLKWNMDYIEAKELKSFIRHQLSNLKSLDKK